MRMEVNPYAPPQSEITLAHSEEETLRRAHLSAEGSVKSVGVLLILGGLMTSSAGANATVDWVPFGPLAVPASFLTILGAIQAGVGIGIRLLQPWSRIPGIILCTLGLLRFPAGTIFCVFFIYYLANTRGSFVLSPAYRSIVAATPHVKRKSSAVFLVLLFILLVVLGLVIYWVVVTSGL